MPPSSNGARVVACERVAFARSHRHWNSHWNSHSHRHSNRHSNRHSLIARRLGAPRASTNDREFVRVARVSFAYPGSARDVLRDVTVSFPRRGLTLIVGRSGSGKSSLLSVVAGLSAPREGSVAIGNDALGDGAREDERLSCVGMVFQFPERHFLGRTVMQELTFGWPQSANGFAKRRALAYRMNDALRAVGMERIALDTDVRALSGGYKRRLALAIQLVRDPSVLCLDEPLAGLDWQTRAEVTALLNDLKRDRAVIVVSHDVEEISRIADRAYRMANMGALTDVSDELAGARPKAFGAAAGDFAAFD